MKTYENFETWEVKSDHDSGWRDGFGSPLFEEYIQLTKKLNPNARPIDCEVEAKFRWLKEPQIVEPKGYTYDQENFNFKIQWR